MYQHWEICNRERQKCFRDLGTNLVKYITRVGGTVQMSDD